MKESFDDYTKGMNYAAVIVAAGKGSRSGLSYNKVLFPYQDKPIVQHSIERFLEDSACQQIVVVCARSELDIFQKLFQSLDTKRITFAIGGNTRAESVASGLSLVALPYVFIHDGARPFFTSNLLERLKISLAQDQAVVPGIEVVDTIKEINEEGYVIYTPKRSHLRAIQTPQAFSTSLIQEALQQVLKKNLEVTDDAMAIETVFGIPSRLIPGELTNQKITSIQDIEFLKQNGS